MLGPEVRLRWLGWLVLGGCLPGGPVVPWVGTWRYQDGGVVENTCADDLYRDPDASFVILSSSLTGFEATDGEVFSCALQGSVFTCPERRSIDVPIGETGTTLTWTVAVAGTFAGPLHIDGTQTFDVSCAGTLCELDTIVLGYELPCRYVVAFSADAG